MQTKSLTDFIPITVVNKISYYISNFLNEYLIVKIEEISSYHEIKDEAYEKVAKNENIVNMESLFVEQILLDENLERLYILRMILI